MTDRAIRLARVRDFAITAAGGAALALGAIFIAARLFFRNYFVLTNRPDPLVFGLVCLGGFLLLGILHTFLPAPLPGETTAAYKGTSGR